MSYKRWVLLGLWDKGLISEVWGSLTTNRLVEAATGLGVEDDI